MDLEALSPSRYLGSDAIIEARAAGVEALAHDLDRTGDAIGFAQQAFEWVRDQIAHSVDVSDRRITISATQVLDQGVGLCFAKSHLLVALLRSKQIPAGLCYQRLAGGAGFALHGLVAVHLDGAWHRLDPRGNNAAIDARFDVGTERLAWRPDPARGEIDYPRVWEAPSPLVLEALRSASDALDLCAGGLPDRPE
jgi:transglutaminase-like putative cysteine protease